MIKPDVILCWPKDIYYPLFVYQINRDRELFDRVIVVMTPGKPEHDFTNEVKRIKDCTILTPDIESLTAGGKDWRDVAVKEGLKKSNAEYVLFLEQDFLFDKFFFNNLFVKACYHNTVGILDSNRFHPCCLLVARKILDSTSVNFSANPPMGDHFSLISDELKDKGGGQEIEALGIEGWHHISGFSYNYQIPEAFHKREEFYTYNYYADFLEQPSEWREFCREKFKNIQRPELDKNIATYFEEFI